MRKLRENDAHACGIFLDPNNFSHAFDGFDVFHDDREAEVHLGTDGKRGLRANEHACPRDVRHILLNERVEGLELLIDRHATVDASPKQAASGLLALCIVQSIGTFWLSRHHRVPIMLVWSTPGVALLAGMGTVRGGWSAAVGAFMLAGVAYVITGLWPALGRLIARIPTPIAQAMLAGVVLELCLAPVTSLVDNPAAIVPIVLV